MLGWPFVGHVVSALVGADADFHAAARDGQFHVGNAGAVVEAHIALQSAGVLAGAVRRQGLAVVITLAVGHRAYLILIVLQRRDGLVLVGHLVQVGGYLHPVVVALAGLAAVHDEVVDGVAVGIPCQHHAALACLC